MKHRHRDSHQLQNLMYTYFYEMSIVKLPIEYRHIYTNISLNQT